MLCTIATARAFASGLPSADPAALGISSERLERLHNRLQAYIDGNQLPGAVLLAARHGRVATLRAFGSLDVESRAAMRPDGIFPLASASKIVTTVALLTVFEEGRLSLRDSVATHLPEFARLTVADASGAVVPAKRPLRIRDLLRHTSGHGYGFDENRQAVYRKAGIMQPGPELDWSHDFTLAEWAVRLAEIPLAAWHAIRLRFWLGSRRLVDRATDRAAAQQRDRRARAQAA